MCNIIEAWQNYLQTKSLKESSYLRDESRFRLHLAPYWGDAKLESIKTRDIFLFRQHLLTKKLNPQTVKLCLSQLRRIMNRARQMELYAAPLPYFEMPSYDSRRLRFLSESEASHLLKLLSQRSELWHDITLFALNTGLRAGEIFSLSSSQVNVELGFITLYDTKNSYTRVVPLNEVALSVVQRYLAKKQKFLFSKTKIYSVTAVFRDVVQQSGLNAHIQDQREKIVFHSLRHTFASWLVQKGVPLVVVGSLLGHKGMQMTMRYAHLSPDQGKNAAALLPSTIGDKGCQ